MIKRILDLNSPDIKNMNKEEKLLNVFDVNNPIIEGQGRLPIIGTAFSFTILLQIKTH